MPYFIFFFLSLLLISQDSLAENQFISEGAIQNKSIEAEVEKLLPFPKKLVIYTQDGILFGNKNQITGDIASHGQIKSGVNAFYNGTLFSDGSIEFLENRNGSQVFESVFAGNRIQRDNSVRIRGLIRERQGQVIGDMPMPDWEVRTGNLNIRVRAGREEVLGEGRFGDLVLERGSTLFLKGGRYHFKTVVLGEGARVIYGDSSHIMIHGHFEVGNESEFFSEDGRLSPEDFTIIAKQSKKLGEVTIGNKVRFEGMLSVPHTVLNIGSDSHFEGVITAFQLITGLRFEMSYSPACQPEAEICGDGIDQDCNLEDLVCECEPSPEMCDGEDNDCDGFIDESPFDGGDYYEDLDGDGYGNQARVERSCVQPEGYVENDLDCDDDNININPEGVEVCDEIDNNCDAIIDLDAIDREVFYEDFDEDGLGNGAQQVLACRGQDPEFLIIDGNRYVDNEEDCDDSNPNPNVRRQDLYRDADRDGFGINQVIPRACLEPGLVSNLENGEDCDDGNNQVTLPGEWFTDADGDSFINPDIAAVISCDQPDNNPIYIDSQGLGEDCNDEDDNITRITLYIDGDEDGYGVNYAGNEEPITGCEESPGLVASIDEDTTDCNDEDPGINPGAPQYFEDADTNCNGEIDIVSENLSVVGDYVGQGLGHNGNYTSELHYKPNVEICNLDGDGIDDLLIGTPKHDLYDENGDLVSDDIGKVNIIFGSSIQNPDHARVSSITELSDITFNGFDHARCGSHVACRDLNGDGLDEVVIGCRDAFVEREGRLPDGSILRISQGMIFIFSGRNNVDWSETPSINLENLSQGSNDLLNQMGVGTIKGRLSGVEADGERRVADLLGWNFRILDDINNSGEFSLAHFTNTGERVILTPISHHYIGHHTLYETIINNPDVHLDENQNIRVFKIYSSFNNNADLISNIVSLHIDNDGIYDFCLSNNHTDTATFVDPGGQILCLYGGQNLAQYPQETQGMNQIDQFRNVKVFGTEENADLVDTEFGTDLKVDENGVITVASYSHVYKFTSETLRTISELQADEEPGFTGFQPSMVNLVDDDRFDEDLYVVNYEDLLQTHLNTNNPGIFNTSVALNNNDLYLSSYWINDNHGGVLKLDTNFIQNGISRLYPIEESQFLTIDQESYFLGRKVIATDDGVYILSAGDVLDAENFRGAISFIPTR